MEELHMSQEKESARLKRINELAHKAKTEGLTETEKPNRQNSERNTLLIFVKE